MTLLRSVFAVFLACSPVFLFATVYPDSIQRIRDIELIEVHFTRLGEGNGASALKARLTVFSIFNAVAVIAVIGSVYFSRKSPGFVRIIVVAGITITCCYLLVSLLNPASILYLYIRNFGMTVGRLLALGYLAACLIVPLVLLRFACNSGSH